MERTIKVMEEKFLLSSLELVEAVFTDHENADEGKLVRSLVEEIRGMNTYIPELELIMVDEQDAPIGYCMFSRFHLEGRYEKELLILTPVAVKTELQRRHISKELIEYGFEAAKKLGYKVVMVTDTLILVIVCFFYGFAHHIFPRDIAFLVCCVNYILDAVISLASMAANVYVQDLSDSADETKATISTGVSINHVITIFIALFGGWIWETLGIETLFIVSAVLGLCNSAYAATIKTGPRKTAA